MSKKIEAINSPFEFTFFRKDIVDYWVAEKKAVYLPDGRFRFREKFELAIMRKMREDEMFRQMTDDGQPRRWVTGFMSKQLKLMKEVGTMPGVTRRPDKLFRRTRRDRGRTVMSAA